MLETMLPMMATPIAPPTWRVVSLMAEPTPALLRGSEPMTDSVAGAIVRPIPAAITMKNEITSGYGESASMSDRSDEPDGDQQQTGGHDPLGAETLDEAGPTAARRSSS